MNMASWLKDAVPHIWAGAVGVVLAIVLGFGLYFIVDGSDAGKEAPTPAQSTGQP
jgi:ABC-type phosphate transport system auxiliary subunit